VRWEKCMRRDKIEEGYEIGGRCEVEGMDGHLRLVAVRPGATLLTARGMRLIFLEEASRCSTTTLTLAEEEEV